MLTDSSSTTCHARGGGISQTAEGHDGDDGYIDHSRQPRVGWPRVRIHGYPRGCLVWLIWRILGSMSERMQVKDIASRVPGFGLGFGIDGNQV